MIAIYFLQIWHGANTLILRAHNVYVRILWTYTTAQYYAILAIKLVDDGIYPGNH